MVGGILYYTSTITIICFYIIIKGASVPRTKRPQIDDFDRYIWFFFLNFRSIYNNIIIYRAYCEEEASCFDNIIKPDVYSYIYYICVCIIAKSTTRILYIGTRGGTSQRIIFVNRAKIGSVFVLYCVQDTS